MPCSASLARSSSPSRGSVSPMTHGKNVSPPGLGALDASPSVSPRATLSTSLRYTKTVHARRSSLLWSWWQLTSLAQREASPSLARSSRRRNPSESTLSSRAASPSFPSSPPTAPSASPSARSFSDEATRAEVCATMTESFASLMPTFVTSAALAESAESAFEASAVASAERYTTPRSGGSANLRRGSRKDSARPCLASATSARHSSGVANPSMICHTPPVCFVSGRRQWTRVDFEGAGTSISSWTPSFGPKFLVSSTFVASPSPSDVGGSCRALLVGGDVSPSMLLNTVRDRQRRLRRVTPTNARDAVRLDNTGREKRLSFGRKG